MQFFARMRDAMARFMYGRNGVDQLNIAMLWVSIGADLLATILMRQQNGLAPVAETADTDAQADRMAALYFSTDDGDAYDAQWLAILDTEVEGKVSIGDCYSYKLQNGGWDITDWNNMDLLPTPAFKLLKSADVTMVGISFTNEGGVVLLPY